ncbi:MAG: hypothetical protein LQ342_002201 [Letrouitia transgressa]|nr:MAG: hypothetical protein LQ342_002201 [Letrouitia transgressa]
MPPSPTQEGEIPFDVPAANKPCKTWYQVYGSFDSNQRPLVALHGGPGVPHNYLLPLLDLTTQHAIPVILYDQLGCGKSTHLPEKRGDGTFWTIELFLAELANLLAHLRIQNDYDVLGHSWGGMLGACHAVAQPAGLKHLVIADSPADMESWVRTADRLRTKLPDDVQETLTRCEREGKEDSAEYEQAMMVYYDRHVCRVKPMPGDLAESFRLLKEDQTVYWTMNGPSEFYVSGTLKTWNIVSQIQKIQCPTLLINGRYDEAQDEVVAPYFREIGKVKWIRFAESSHMPHFEEREVFMKVVAAFLKRDE